MQCQRPGFDPWVGMIRWRKELLPTPVFWPGEFRGLYSPWDRQESDTTEQISLTSLACRNLKKKCIFDTKFKLLKKISWYFYMSYVNLKILPNHVDSEPDAKQK